MAEVLAHWWRHLFEKRMRTWRKRRQVERRWCWGSTLKLSNNSLRLEYARFRARRVLAVVWPTRLTMHMPPPASVTGRRSTGWAFVGLALSPVAFLFSTLQKILTKEIPRQENGHCYQSPLNTQHGRMAIGEELTCQVSYGIWTSAMIWWKTNFYWTSANSI